MEEKMMMRTRLTLVLVMLGLVSVIMMSPVEGTRNMMQFGMLPKGTRIPPSGPSTRTSDSPPPPPPPSGKVVKQPNYKVLNYFPKGTPIPPSGPSTRTSNSTSPPPPSGKVVKP
ncbi:hypothetical protein LOK49_LG08G01402 [Camellia lanceoleosa]|uniref:Uncharacterized protein n=1 Tax=Camellia lanceoleosa TaxID=1840588 RepID=A0ACC0GUW7_9ERIC|nr:hypothetical protein LOK49_LG08G01402 [Camellia lanceoleosa]